MTEEKLNSEGKCIYCEAMFKKSGISKHLDGHLKTLASEKPSKDKAYHLRVQASEFFLNLLIDANLTLDMLDDYLRGIWLECCGHMSSFRVKGREYEDDFESENGTIGEDMSQPLAAALTVGLKMIHEYDFGSTTELEINVLSEHQITVKEGIKLLSRNEPLHFFCEMCKTKPATEICTAHDWDEPSLFCKPCSKKHAKVCEEFEEYAALKVVNSPRCGVCAYEGGEIDKKRDKAWKMV